MPINRLFVFVFQIARQSYLDYLKNINKAENMPNGENKETSYTVSEPGCSHANVRFPENSDDSIGAAFESLSVVD